MKFDYLLHPLYVLRIRALNRRVSSLETRVSYMEESMAKNDEALARLDAELDKLEQYVNSDDETDAAQVDARAQRIRNLLAAAQGSGQLDNDGAAEREQRLSDVVAEVESSDESQQ